MKNKKGFTLIELVITVSLISVVVLFFTTFITPLFTISDSIYNETEAISMTNTIHNSIIEELRKLVKVESITEENGEKTILNYTSTDPNDPLNGNKLAAEIFPGRDISVTFEENRLIYVTIIIYDEKGKEITNTIKTIAPPNYIQQLK